LLLISSASRAQQSTLLDFVSLIRTFNSLNADGLENKNSRDEYCKGLPADRLPSCTNYMDTLGASRRKMDQSISAIEDAAKKGAVDRKILLRLDAQILNIYRCAILSSYGLDEK
jgi:hypothetical protein